MIADEWQPHPRALPDGLVRHELPGDPVRVVLPAAHPAALAHPDAVPLAALAGEPWATGEAGMGWEEMTRITCRALGGFDPDIRHRVAGATVALALVERRLAVTMLPELPLAGRGAAEPGGSLAVRAIADGAVGRTIFAATRSVDAERPSTRALLAAVQVAAASP